MINVVNKAKTLPEVFDTIRRCETKEQKIQLLKSYNTITLRMFVYLMYCEDLSQFKLPKVVPNNRPPEICNMTLHTARKRIMTAINSKNEKVFEKNMTIVLEEISAPEHELLVNLFAGKKIEGISKSIFKEVYPDLFRFQESDETTQEVSA